LHQLGDEVRSIALAGELVNANDIRMIQRGQRLGFQFKFARIALFGGQDLDGDVALQAVIAGALHFAHAARAKGREDFVGT